MEQEKKGFVSKAFNKTKGAAKSTYKVIATVAVAIIIVSSIFGAIYNKSKSNKPIVEAPEVIYEQVVVDVGASGLIASDVKTNQKYFSKGIDSESRYTKFEYLGLRTQHTLTISGVLDINKLNASAVGYIGNREAYPAETPEYYAVGINISFYVSENAEFIFVSDELGSRYVNDPILNGYLDTTAYYAVADADKNWSICGVTQANGTTDGYVYYEIQDKNHNIINSFFYHTVYNIIILAAEVSL